MSSARFIFTLCLAMLFTGCGGTEVAEEYARKMTTVLATYRSQVEKKIQAAQDNYTALAFAYAADEENRLVQNLDVDRNARASALADDIGQHGVHPTTSETLNRLREYAEDDLAVAEKLLTRDMESYRNT